ncbi:MAG TPA: hypothetical protein VMF14_04395 [Solirubrobacteraceae bacterium]|nr:hypothetical protein [Solirubrobacteraceae bacterium]
MIRRALSLLVAGCATAGALALPVGASAATPPPASGTWHITPEHSQPGPSVDVFTGTFKVQGNRVSGLQGITQRRVNSGCDRGEHVSMVGSAAIRHALDPSVGEDFYSVSVASPISFVKVHLTFQGRGSKRHPAKVHRASAMMRIYFPGGSETIGGFTAYSNITYGTAFAGTCNLKFSIAAP